jgi:hypothetical protein
MNFLQYEFTLSEGDAIEVSLDKQANVKLLDDNNYASYKLGAQHRYYGGKAIKSPIIIKAPHAGHWNLVIDLGGYPGSVRASVRVLKG